MTCFFRTAGTLHENFAIALLNALSHKLDDSEGGPPLDSESTTILGGVVRRAGSACRGRIPTVYGG